MLEVEQACFKQPWLEKDCLYELNENPFSSSVQYEKMEIPLLATPFLGNISKWRRLTRVDDGV